MAATYTKPTKIPRWADTGTRTEPSSGKKDTGWIFEEPPPYGWENWLQGINGDWWKWIDERFFDGASEDDILIKNPGAATNAWRCEANASTFYEPTTIDVSGSTLTNASGFTSNAKGNGTGVTGTGSGTGHGVQGTGSTGANSSGVTGTGSAITAGAGLIGVRGFGGHANSGNGGSGVYGLGGTENGGTPGPGGWFVAATGGIGCSAETSGNGTALKGVSVAYPALALVTDNAPTKGTLNIDKVTTAPSSPDDGDIWQFTNRLYGRFNGGPGGTSETTTITPAVWANIAFTSSPSVSLAKSFNCSQVACAGGGGGIPIIVTLDAAEPISTTTTCIVASMNTAAYGDVIVTAIAVDTTHIHILGYDAAASAYVDWDTRNGNLSLIVYNNV